MKARVCVLLVVGAVMVAVGAVDVSYPPVAAAHELSLQSQPPDISEIEEALDRVPPGASPHEAARILFPDDPEAQNDYIRRVLDIDGESPGGSQVIPVLAAFVPVLTKCVVGGLGGAAVAEGVNLVRSGEHLAMESLVDAAIGGCITGVLPKPLMAIAEAAKKPLVTAIAAIIIRLSSLEG